MESRLDKANRELQNILNTLTKLLNDRDAAAIELANTSLVSLNAHLLLVTSSDNPKTTKEMKARIELAEKSEVAEKARIKAEENLKDLKQKIETYQGKRLEAEMELKQAQEALVNK